MSRHSPTNGVRSADRVKVTLYVISASMTILLPSSLICPLHGNVSPAPATISTRLNPFLSNSPCKLGVAARPTLGEGLSFTRMAPKVLPVCVIRYTLG